LVDYQNEGRDRDPINSRKITITNWSYLYPYPESFCRLFISCLPAICGYFVAICWLFGNYSLMIL